MIVDLGQLMKSTVLILNELNSRHKVTIKKTYVNDIIYGVKGAQNIAQKVILVVTDAPSLIPPKKYKKVKQHKSDDEEDAKTNPKTPVTPIASVPKVQGAVSRGYDSENEKSTTDSQSTATTLLPNNFKKRILSA